MTTEERADKMTRITNICVATNPGLTAFNDQVDKIKQHINHDQLDEPTRAFLDQELWSPSPRFFNIVQTALLRSVAPEFFEQLLYSQHSWDTTYSQLDKQSDATVDFIFSTFVPQV